MQVSGSVALNPLSSPFRPSQLGPNGWMDSLRWLIDNPIEDQGVSGTERKTTAVVIFINIAIINNNSTPRPKYNTGTTMIYRLNPSFPNGLFKHVPFRLGRVREEVERASGARLRQQNSFGGNDRPPRSGRRMSWRQAIFSRVVSPRLHASLVSVATVGSNREERDAIARMKLDYEEITPCSEEDSRPRWLAFLDAPDRQTRHFDSYDIRNAVKAGVPRDLRARVWEFLAEEQNKDGREPRGQPPPPYVYRELLKELTGQQHAILVDLGRTFPSHPFFARQLGPGQLALFNLLKAYSLLDREVGYCQGLSFIAAALLLHMEEEEAFTALVNIMYGFGLRKQYLPDMQALQVEMYQLSRLLHDRSPELARHLEEHEIPVLYAAPWFLTLFASTFPLGFVARVFDFLFLCGGLEVVFGVAVVLLSEHAELIRHCDSFEAINEFLKTTLPAMSIIQMERIFNTVMDMDLSRELLAYEVEYQVLQEEMMGNPPSRTNRPPIVVGRRRRGPAPSTSTGAPPPESSEEDEDEEEASDASLDDGRLQELQVLNRSLQDQARSLEAEVVRLRSRAESAESERDEAKRSVAELKEQMRRVEERVAGLETERKDLLLQLRQAKPNGAK